MPAPLKILHLEDLSHDAQLVAHELKKASFGFERLVVTGKKDFKQALKSFAPDVILADHSLPAFNSVEAFEIVKEMNITAPFILVTGNVSEEFAVSRIKDGVADYLLKDRLERLPTAITNALEKQQAELERQRFLNRVIENENLLRKTERLARIGSWTRELDTQKINWSDEVFCMFGYQPGEITPSYDVVLKHVHPDDLITLKKVSDETFHKNGNSKITFRINDKNGIAKWIYCELLVERSPKGKPVILRGFNQDVTEQKNAEAEIIMLNESLEKKVKERTDELLAANKEMETFSYTVAHDLRAPLRITNGFVSLLLNEHRAGLNSEAQYLLTVIKENATQMSDLVTALFDLSCMGRVTASAVDCDMYNIVLNACEFVKAADENNRANIRLLELPPIKCDPHLVKQVWVNLISNAIKYSAKTKHPFIEIGGKVEESKTVYYVKDNGAGFDMALSEKLFRPFQRLHKKSDYDGTGVGLALAQLIVSKHGGEMWAEGITGEGATFYFSLPN